MEIIGGRYQKVRELGEGGFGKTFIGTDQHKPSNSNVVIKELSYQGNVSSQTRQIIQQRFEEEARTLESVSKGSPNIPVLEAYITENNNFYLIQEYIDGLDLSQLKQSGLWSETEARWFLHNALPIIAYIHSQGVIHRDIKPANFMFQKSTRIGQEDKLYLIDFGAVKVQREIKETAIGTGPQPSIIIGTEGYWPSEQKQGFPVPQSDIYALGVTTLSMMTHTDPTQFPIDPSTRAIHIDSILPANVSIELKNILKNCVIPDYQSRYQNANQIINDLNQSTTTEVIASGARKAVERTEYVQQRATSFQDKNSTGQSGYPDQPTYQDRMGGTQNHYSQVPPTNVYSQIPQEQRMGPKIKAALITFAIAVTGAVGWSYVSNQNPRGGIANINGSDTDTKEAKSNKDQPKSSENNSENKNETQLDLKDIVAFPSSTNYVKKVDDNKLITFAVPDNWRVYSKDWVRNKKNIGVKLLGSADATDDQTFFKEYKSSSFFVGITKRSLNFADLSKDCKKFSFVNDYTVLGRDVNTKISDRCGEHGQGKFVESIGTYKNSDSETIYFTIQTQIPHESEQGVIDKIFPTVSFPLKQDSNN